MRPKAQSLQGAYYKFLDEAAAYYLSSALTKTHGKIKDAAKLVGVNPDTLANNLRRLGLRDRLHEFRRCDRLTNSNPPPRLTKILNLSAPIGRGTDFEQVSSMFIHISWLPERFMRIGGSHEVQQG